MGRKIPSQRIQSNEHFKERLQTLPDRLWAGLEADGIHVPLDSQLVHDALAGRDMATSLYSATKER